MIKVSLKEILKMDVGILNKYFLVTLILVLLTVVGYTSYALFSYEEVSSTGIRLKYSGSVKQSEGNLSNNWRSKTANETKYLALYTLGSSNLPETYEYNNETYTLSTTIDVSEQGNGNVILGEYTSGSNIIGIIGQNGKVIAPTDSSNLFRMDPFGDLNYNCKILDLSNFDTSNVTNMSYMFFCCSGLTNLDLSNFDTSKVINMGHMFQKCSSLPELDLSKFDTRQVTDFSYMFAVCTNLTSITVGCNFVIGTSSSTTSMNFDKLSVTKVCDE